MKPFTFLFVIVFAVVTAGKGLCYDSSTAGSEKQTVPVQLPSQEEGITYTQDPQLDSTGQLISLVKDAAAMIRNMGEAAFDDFRKPDSHWQQGEKYIFVLDTVGHTLVHPAPELIGKDPAQQKDVNGKPIIRGLIEAATARPEEQGGWYHYQWPVPGQILPRWKSSYVQLVRAPSGKSFVVGSGMYSDRMEREFVVDMVKDAVADIEQNKEEAFKRFYDPAGPYMAKDAYIFILDSTGTELVNPAFRNLEGRNVMDLKDAKGKYLARGMFDIVNNDSSGWVEYMWPKPGESVSTEKSAYVSKADMGDKWVLVGSGVYLADAPKDTSATKSISAPELMSFVNSAAAELKKRGEKAFPEFRRKGSKWFQGDTYLFVWTLDGTRVFHAADPSMEGKKVNGTTDATGRPYGRMFLETANSAKGEGWVHYVFPEPGDIFPAWKSSFVKRVTFPSGKQYLVGSGIYNMQMDKAFIEDVVNRAAALVKVQGKDAFDELRDKQGPFNFMDTYVFVTNKEGVELVNPAQPSLEGRNLLNEKDVKGMPFVREFIAKALKNGSAWVDYYWYKPGENTPTQKHTYVRKVVHGGETYIIGSGFYEDEKAGGSAKGSH